MPASSSLSPFLQNWAFLHLMFLHMENSGCGRGPLAARGWGGVPGGGGPIPGFRGHRLQHDRGSLRCRGLAWGMRGPLIPVGLCTDPPLWAVPG